MNASNLSIRFFALKAICFFMLFVASFQLKAQSLCSGFNARECDDMYLLNNAFFDTTTNNTFPNFLDGYRFLHRSPSIGLDNVWDMWLRADSTIIFTLRGTTADPKSLMADFYCAMFPAKGRITLKAGEPAFEYQLATEPKAAVHGGFLVSFVFIAIDMKPKMDSLYAAGYRNYIVSGHSQGGALCYYLSASLMQQKRMGVYPNINVKTYASAAPKMGNMYFLYDYDNVMEAKWSFSIVNTADPVPEIPLTTQQLEIDMNTPNPMIALEKRFDNLPFFKRIVLKNAFNKMKRNAKKSSNAYQKYLGGYAGGVIKKMVPGLVLPEPIKSTYFQRPGVLISLLDNENFRANCDNISAEQPYYNHGFEAYRYLLRQYYKNLPALQKK